MSRADYRLCDVCGEKVFYDANLNYDHGRDVPKEDMARVAGEADWPGYRLGYLGDWAVICRNCAKTHKTVVVEISEERE